MMTNQIRKLKMRRDNENLKGFLTILFVGSFIGCLGMIFLALYTSVDFHRNIGGYLKRAADANTIELAKKELRTALTEIERRKLVEGSSDIFWSTPSTDVGFWYSNLKASLDELETVKPATNLMEKTNILMKLRETLLDHGQHETITEPDNIEMFPYQKLFTIVIVIFAICMTMSGILLGTKN